MRIHRLALLVMATALVAACKSVADGLVDPTTAGVAAAPPAAEQAEALPRNRVLLKAATPEAASRAVAESRGRVVGELAWLGVKVIELPEPAAEAMAERLATLPGVIYAEADAIASVGAPPEGKGPGKGGAEPTPEAPSVACDEPNDPNDPGFNGGEQWGLATIGAESAWDAGHRSEAGIRIAILDTGIDEDHEDLGKVVYGKNFTRSKTKDDRYGHGTHVAGIAAGATSNCVGVAGAGYHASLMNLKVLDDDGSGYHSWIAAGLHEAVARGAHVVNMSLGASAGSQTLKEAIEEAQAAGLVLVAAAGNSGGAASDFPAAYPEVIAVSATDPQDRKASFSNQGAEVAAPGVGILSTLPNHNNRLGAMHYGRLDGTSMAAPFVAGAAAVLWRIEAALASDTPINARVRARLQRSGVGGEATGSAHGRIDMASAVR